MRKKKLIVFVFLSPDCPLCKNYSVALNDLQKNYGRAVQIVGIVPGKSYSSAEINDFIQKYKINFDIYIDSSRTISRTLHATVTPEVFLVRDKGIILYRGAIDNWIKELGMQRTKATEFYLHDAIGLALSDKPVII